MNVAMTMALVGYSYGSTCLETTVLSSTKLIQQLKETATVEDAGYDVRLSDSDDGMLLVTVCEDGGTTEYHPMPT